MKPESLKLNTKNTSIRETEPSFILTIATTEIHTQKINKINGGRPPLLSNLLSFFALTTEILLIWYLVH